MPHAPLLVPGVRSELGVEDERVRASMAEIDVGDVEAVVLVSSHGERSGVYPTVDGSLEGFGIRGICCDRATDPELTTMLVGAWGKGVIAGPVDHGVAVPLLLGLAGNAPVVAATLAEVTGAASPGVGPLLEDARSLAAALVSVSDQRRIALVTSLNTSAALTPRAPLGYRAEAAEIESSMLSALQSDVGALPSLAPELWVQGGSCGAGPLWVLGSIFSGSAAAIAAYEHPFGVGYLVATVPA